MRVIFTIIALLYLAAEAKDCVGDKVYYQPPGAPSSDCYCPIGKKMNFNVQGNNAANGAYRVGRCHDSYQSIGYGQTNYDIATPLQIDGGAGNLMMWYDAMDPLATGYVPPINGLSLPVWFDKSGNNRNFVCSTGSAPQVYNLYNLGGGGYSTPFYGVYFNGTSANYYIYNGDVNMPSNFFCSAGGYTIAMVISVAGTRANSLTIFSSISNNNFSGNTNYDWFHVIMASNSYKLYSFVGGGGVNYGSLQTNGTISSAPGVFVTTYSGDLFNYIGPNTAADSSGGPWSVCPGSSNYQYYLGADDRTLSGNGEGNGYFYGYIAELVVFKTALSAANLQKLQNYLYYKNNL